ncbi:MAG: energy transducer TonB, partial [Bacteroidales bacterium]|nr:energy transducer TonB [Bacteroidales bacterium]
KYNLMTNYTSFVAIDEVVVNKDGKQTTVKQPIPMPEGVSDYAVGHDAAELSTTVNRVSGLRNQSAKLSSVNISRMVAVEEEIEEEEEVFMVVENDPEFPGGMEAMMKFLAENIVYPQEAKDNNIQGRVFVSFVVEKDGSISNIKVIRDIGGGCGAEVVRVVKLMPKWKPATQKGKPVRVQFNLPVQFTIPKE